jgi:hypothetical protein
MELVRTDVDVGCLTNRERWLCVRRQPGQPHNLYVSNVIRDTDGGEGPTVRRMFAALLLCAAAEQFPERGRGLPTFLRPIRVKPRRNGARSRMHSRDRLIPPDINHLLFWPKQMRQGLGASDGWHEKESLAVRDRLALSTTGKVFQKWLTVSVVPGEAERMTRIRSSCHVYHVTQTNVHFTVFRGSICFWT